MFLHQTWLHPDWSNPGLRVAGQARIEDACVSSCVHFLPQPGLHLAVLLFKNAVSCGLLTSVLSGLHLARDQQTIVHCYMSIGGFLLHFSLSLCPLCWRIGRHKPRGSRKSKRHSFWIYPQPIRSQGLEANSRTHGGSDLSTEELKMQTVPQPGGGHALCS